MVRYKNDIIIDRIIGYLEDNIRRNVSIEEAADFAGRSASTVSHLFKETLGLSFKQISIDLRMNKAEEFLQSGFTVTQASEAVGYEDPYYFSRLFKKNRGAPPSRYKAGA
jgi:AraC-like DNA-binding protein